MADKLGLGLIGVSAAGAWSARSHLPRVQTSSDVELTAVCTTSRQRRGGAPAQLDIDAAPPLLQHISRPHQPVVTGHDVKRRQDGERGDDVTAIPEMYAIFYPGIALLVTLKQHSGEVYLCTKRHRGRGPRFTDDDTMIRGRIVLVSLVAPLSNDEFI